MEQQTKKPDFQYIEMLPPKEVSHLALCFFEFTIKGGSRKPIPHEVFPDGCVSLLYRYNKRLGLKILLIKGLSLKTFHTEVHSGDILSGIRFSPASCAQILRCDPKEILTQPIFDSNLLPHLTKGLLEKLVECTNFKSSAAVFEELLKSLAIHPTEIDEKIVQAIEIIELSNGEAKISEIANNVGLSTRQLERRFRKSSGITPKQYSRTWRFRATARNIVETDINWAHRAAELGFADQAHLAKEISALTGRTPNSLTDVLKLVKHEDLIK